MRCEQNGRPVVPVFFPEKIAQRQLAHGIESNGRFIEKEQLRPVQKGPAQLRAHALSKTELAQRRAQ